MQSLQIYNKYHYQFTCSSKTACDEN